MGKISAILVFERENASLTRSIPSSSEHAASHLFIIQGMTNLLTMKAN